MKTLANKIKVKTAYTRSIHLERDSALVSAYLPGTIARRTLHDLAQRLATPGSPRAFALIAPYGAGKSAFALFVSHLLSAPQSVATRRAFATCKDCDTALATVYQKIARGKRGFCPVLITGSPQPLTTKFLLRLADALTSFGKRKLGKEIHAAAASDDVTVAKAMAFFALAEIAVRDAKSGGMLVVFDELGKHLEYEARIGLTDGVFLLQELAEYARAKSESNIVVLTLLHQSFGQYARGLGRDARNEWSKAQGRFEEVAFVEQAEQTLQLVCRALDCRFSSAERTAIRKATTSAAHAIFESGVLPGASATNTAKLLTDCYPLHPVAAVMLPFLCQKLAQNERTLFSYLSGGDGFQSSVAHLCDVGEFVGADAVFDYFIAARPPSDTVAARKRAEAIAALDRLGDAPADTVKMLKTIALFNIVGARGKFAATPALLESCFANTRGARAALRVLREKSLIVFRRFVGEFRVWQGSDFDLDEALVAEIGKLGALNTAEELNLRAALPPLIAHKHAVDTGNLRALQSLFTDAESITNLPKEAAQPRLIVFLPFSPADKKRFAKQAPSFSNRDLLLCCENAKRLAAAVRERTALARVLAHHPDLQGDPPALRETKQRASDAARIERDLLRSITSPGGVWCWQGQIRQIQNRRDLQTLVSDLMDAVYHKAPHIHNELINRDKPSAQAAAARRKLLLALAENEDKPNLAIDKFPPEKAIYLSLFRASGLHRNNGGGLRLCMPNPKNDPYNLVPVWDEIQEFIASTASAPRSFTELDNVLRGAPYGIKAGALPIFHIAAILHGKDDIAIFEDGAFVPFFTAPHIARFLARPDLFKIQQFAIAGFRAKVMEQYVRLLADGKIGGAPKTALAVARPFAVFYNRLPEYARQTDDISREARALRTALSYSKSPQHMLFESIPRALGFGDGGVEEYEKAGFYAALKGALSELNQAHPRLRARFASELAQKMGLAENAPLAETREVASNQSAGLTRYALATRGLRPFVLSLIESHSDDEHWLSGVLMTLAQKPAEKWNDADVAKAEINLAQWTRQINDLQCLHLHDTEYREKRKGDFYLMRIARSDELDCHEFAFIDDADKDKICEIADRLLDALSAHEPDLRRAILAQIMYNALAREEHEMESSDSNKKDAMGGGNAR